MSTRESLAQVPAGQVAVPEPAAEGANPTPAEPADAQVFDILAFKVVGNTVLPQVDVEEAVMPFMGPGRTPRDVEDARAALEAQYQKSGYVTVSVMVPDQGVMTGIIRLNVVERRVGELQVAHLVDDRYEPGARFVSEQSLKNKAVALQPGTVPNMRDLQDTLAKLNRSRDRQVTPDIKAGTRPDTVDIGLNVEEKFPLHVSAGLDNRQSFGTSSLRANGSVEYADLWHRGDSILVSGQFAPKRLKDSLAISGFYTAHLGDSAATAQLGLTYSDSDVTTLGSTNAIGRGYIASLRFTVPLKGRERFYHSIAFGLDYKDYKDRLALKLQPDNPQFITNRCDVDPNSPDCEVAYDTPVTYWPFAIDYLANWIANDGSTTSLNLGTTFAFRGLGSNSFAFDQKRYQAKPNFWYVRFSVSQLQMLPHGFQLSERVSGQFAGSPLISNEGFSAGGAGSVRGYYESEAIGDWGIANQFELRGPDLLSGKFSFRPHVFVDTGYTYIYDALPSQPADSWLLSAGLGAEATILTALTGGVEIAWPLRAGPNTDVRGQPNILFNLGVDF